SVILTTPRYTLVPYTTLFRSAFVLGKADDTNAGGARSIKNAVQSSIYTGLVDAIIDNPDKKRFSVEVSDDSYIYDHTAVRTTGGDRKSTRLNSSHVSISYGVF